MWVLIHIVLQSELCAQVSRAVFSLFIMKTFIFVQPTTPHYLHNELITNDCINK